jgi:hypothetical protein
MANYVLVYKGGGGMASTDEERQAIMATWNVWFGSLGESLVDGGNPFGPSTTISTDGAVAETGASSLTGYSIISAEDLASATEKAKGCPVLANGGSLEVYETFQAM